MSSSTINTVEPPTDPDRHQSAALVDLLDRLLGAGVVVSGDVTISIAGVDLVEVRLNALITSVRAGMRAGVPGVDPRPSAGEGVR